MTDAGGGPSVEPVPLVPGVPRALSPLVRRIVAPNPSKMTGPGTNTYLVGIDEIAVIDPGPEITEHRDAILGCGGDRIRWILCTHTHPDHAPGAAALASATGATVRAFRSRDGLRVDERMRHGDEIDATEFRLRAHHTPGHASNHLCFVLTDERLMFSGDHVMQGSTVVIRPPDGNMADYLESLRSVRALGLRAIAPGHGHLITDPGETLDRLIDHRLDRERQVLAALRVRGAARIRELVPEVYAGLDPELVPMARRSMHAHLLKLAAEGAVSGRTATGEWTAN